MEPRFLLYAMRRLSEFLLSFLLVASCAPEPLFYDVIVVGGGASGTCAAIQAARLGVNTLIIEEGPWLGGTLTSSGVSAIDGNYRLRGGIFGEFCDSLANHYGGYDALKTGWVSNILFEPHVGAEILSSMAGAEQHLSVVTGIKLESVGKNEDLWALKAGGVSYSCRVLIDGTELGDVARACGAAYEVGNDDGVVQDLTYVITAQDFGRDVTIPEPEGYDRSLYVNCCKNPLNTPDQPKGQALWSPEMMLNYGRLPGGCIMLNWPIEGNDFYANTVDSNAEERETAYAAAKNKALGYLFFMQTELGMSNIGVADGEYPTDDGLPPMPYFRESRRIRGEARLTLAAVRNPYSPEGGKMFRAGVAVGDYPVDHHHFAHPEWEKQHQAYTAIPSFTVPAGVMIPKDVEGLIVAGKSISADCDVAGTTRLQPVVMELGQAAGVIAASAVLEGCRVREVSVRKVQTLLLEAGARLQPYLDVEPSHPDFLAIQRVGCTGILRARGCNSGWADEMWMDIDEPLRWRDVWLEEYYGFPHNDSDAVIDAATMYKAIEQYTGEDLKEHYASDPSRPLTRIEAIRALDTWLHPFEARDVDWKGKSVFKLR